MREPWCTWHEGRVTAPATSRQRTSDLLSEWLQQTPQAERYRELLTDPEAALFSQEEEWIFGEACRPGSSCQIPALDASLCANLRLNPVA